MPNDAWEGFLSDDELAALASPPVVNMSGADKARHIFQQNAALAAQEICDLALGAANERVRLQASQYVVDRILGKVTDASSINSQGDAAPWEGIFAATVREPSAEERNAGERVGRITPTSTHTPNHTNGTPTPNNASQEPHI